MDVKVTSQNYKFECAECRNEVELNQDSSVGDIVECSFCGIEYEITEDMGNGQMTLAMIEEEK